MTRTLRLFDGEADVYGLVGMNMLEVLRHIECYGVEHTTGGIVFKLKLYVLEIMTHELAGTEIEHVLGAEDGLLIARSEGIEFLQSLYEFRCDFGELDFSVNVQLRFKLVGLNVG